MRQKVAISTITFLLLILTGGFTSPVLAYVMESASYRLQQDSINFYGGQSTSTIYKLEDTGGEIATGYSTSTSYMMHAGYQQSAEVYIGISALGDITLASIAGLSGGSSTDFQEVHVTTNNPIGYTLKIHATSSPALKMMSSGETFADYAPAVPGTPDYTWLVAAVDSAFGFSPAGSDIKQKYKYAGSACDQAGGNTTPNHCWDGLNGLSDIDIAASTAGNEPGGATTFVHVKAESGSTHVQGSGLYQATIVLTAHAN